MQGAPQYTFDRHPTFGASRCTLRNESIFTVHHDALTMSETPNWNLLPGNPLKFFQLQQGCDQRALKRAYGKLIRQFKPERFPEEFKKIRAAYEQLQQEIEYGYWEEDLQTTPGYEEVPVDAENAKPESGSEENAIENSGESIIINGPISAPMNVSVDPSWKTRLEKEEPEDLYAELEAKTPKQPDDFLKLAILSDVVIDQPEPGEPPQFETWLLRGIEQSSEPHVLIQSLSNYFEQLPEDRFIDESHLAQFLLQLARVIITHRFFRVALPLWFKLLREASLEKFQETLDRCEVILFDPNEQEKLIFYVQMLNALQWKIDEARRIAYSHGLYQPEFDEFTHWLDTKKEYLEAHYELLPFYNLDNIFDEADLVRLYHNSLGRFLNQDHTILRRRFHEMLRDYVLNTPEIAQEKLIQFQLSVLRDDSEILDCFSSSLEDEKNFLNLWTWMVNDCPAMHTEPETEQSKMKANAIQLLRQCYRVEVPEETKPQTQPPKEILRKLITPIAFLVPLIGGFIYLWVNYVPYKTEIERSEFFFKFYFILAVSIVCAMMAYLIQEPITDSEELDGTKKHSDQRILYQQLLQPLWINFLANNHWQYESVMQIVKMEAENWPYKNITLLLDYTVRDTGA